MPVRCNGPCISPPTLTVLNSSTFFLHTPLWNPVHCKHCFQGNMVTKKLEAAYLCLAHWFYFSVWVLACPVEQNRIILDSNMPTNTQYMHIKSYCEKCQTGLSLSLVARAAAWRTYTQEETHNSYSCPSTGNRENVLYSFSVSNVVLSPSSSFGNVAMTSFSAYSV